MFSRPEPKNKNKKLLGAGLLLGLIGITTATALLSPKTKSFLKNISNLKTQDLGKRLQEMHLPRNMNELYALREPKKQIDTKYLIIGGLLSSIIAAGTALLTSSQSGKSLRKQIQTRYHDAEKALSQNGTHANAKPSRKKKTSSPATPKKAARKLARLVAE